MIIQSLLFLIASLIVFLILTEVLTIDISYGDITVIDVNFTVLAISFIDRKSNTRKKRKKNEKNNFKYISAFVLSASRKSDIILHRLNLRLPRTEPAQNALNKGICFSLLSSLLAYIESNSKNFYLGNISFDDSANNNSILTFDISFRISLLSFLGLLPRFIVNRRKV